jgi:hypothetical protein
MDCGAAEINSGQPGRQDDLTEELSDKVAR